MRRAFLSHRASAPVLGLALGFLLACPSPTQAALSVSIKNDSIRVIDWCTVKTDQGETGVRTRIVPKGSFEIRDDNAQALKSLVCDDGTLRFMFDEEAVAGKLNGDKLSLTFTTDSNMTPTLTSEDGEGVKGTVDRLYNETSGSLDEILACKTMGDVRKLGARESGRTQDQLTMMITFLGSQWQAIIETDSDAVEDMGKSGGNKARGTVLLYATDTCGEEEIGIMEEELNGMGYRPWAFFLRGGEEMNVKEKLYTAKSDEMPDTAAAMELLKNAIKQMPGAEGPAALEVLLVKNENWEQAAKGKPGKNVPGIILRIPAGAPMSARYDPDCSLFLELPKD